MTEPKPLSLEEVRTTLKTRLDYLDAQIKPLADEAKEIRRLLAEPPTPRSPVSKPSGDTRNAILEAVAATPGLSGADYASTAGVTGATALKHLNALEAEGVLRREGIRRGTRWYPS